MKLILANNQTDRFVQFFDELAPKSQVPFVYAGYKQLLFVFDSENSHDPVTFMDVTNGHKPEDFDGVYINGYLNVYELAATVAAVLQHKSIAFVNTELNNAPSLSKLSSYAKLAAAGVTLPKTYGGTAFALMQGLNSNLVNINFPAVLKRADADRGIDNYKIKSADEALELLKNQDEQSVWVLQNFIPNDGFYLVSIYHGKPVFSIFRAMGERPDHNEQKAHMFKPVGGRNATLMEVNELPKSLVDTSVRAAAAMNRQIASVDSIYVPNEDKTYVLEVNYNPQLVTIETFKEVRQQAFLEAIAKIGAEE